MLYRSVRLFVAPETVIPKVRLPVALVVLICHPVLPSDWEMIVPSDDAFPVTYTQALHVMLPVVRTDAAAPISTYSPDPLKESAFPCFAALVQVAP